MHHLSSGTEALRSETLCLPKGLGLGQDVSVNSMPWALALGLIQSL